MKVAYLVIVFLAGLIHIPNSLTSALPSTPAMVTNPAGSAQPQKLERRLLGAAFFRVATRVVGMAAKAGNRVKNAVQSISKGSKVKPSESTGNPLTGPKVSPSMSKGNPVTGPKGSPILESMRALSAPKTKVKK